LKKTCLFFGFRSRVFFLISKNHIYFKIKKNIKKVLQE